MAHGADEGDSSVEDRVTDNMHQPLVPQRPEQAKEFSGEDTDHSDQS